MGRVVRFDLRSFHAKACSLPPPPITSSFIIFYYSRVTYLMSKLAHAGEYHRDPLLIRSGNHLFIADAAARLDDRCRSGLDDDIQSIAERKERIGSDRRTGKVKPGILRFYGGNAGAIHPAHLSCPYAKRLTVGAKHDGVGFDEFCHAPRKQQILKLLRRGLHYGHDFQLRGGDIERVGCLHQQPSAHALEVERIAASLEGYG